jgi:putative SOS response-associated peptidase YedK
MCGRFTVRMDARESARVFGVSKADGEYTPSFNVAPAQKVPVVLIREGQRVMDTFQWGLIPSWAKDPATGNRLINARAETVADKPSFRQAFLRRRCLILADGFYEWKSEGKRKQPVHITLKDRSGFAFAGLWEHWQSPGGDTVKSCTIITTEANAFMRPLHHRMPVILPKDKEDTWLDPATTDREVLLALLVPYPSDLMLAVPVSTFVNRPGNDGPECLLPFGN